MAIIIAASGPSAKRCKIPLGIDVLCVNRFLIDQPKYYMYNDPVMVTQSIEKIRQFKGTIITNEGLGIPVKNCKKYKLYGKPGFSEDKKGYHLCRSSTWAAMQFASWTYDTIYVIGIDQAIEGTTTYHDGSQPLVDKEVAFREEAQLMGQLPAHLKSRFIFVSDLNQREWFLNSRHCTPAELNLPDY